MKFFHSHVVTQTTKQINITFVFTKDLQFVSMQIESYLWKKKHSQWVWKQIKTFVNLKSMKKLRHLSKRWACHFKEIFVCFADQNCLLLLQNENPRAMSSFLFKIIWNGCVMCLLRLFSLYHMCKHCAITTFWCHQMKSIAFKYKLASTVL